MEQAINVCLEYRAGNQPPGDCVVRSVGTALGYSAAIAVLRAVLSVWNAALVANLKQNNSNTAKIRSNQGQVEAAESSAPQSKPQQMTSQPNCDLKTVEAIS